MSIKNPLDTYYLSFKVTAMGIKHTIGDIREFLKDIPLLGDMIAPKPIVSVIHLSGIIAEGGGRKQTINYADYKDLIGDAFESYNLKAVALIINSPGGSPAQSALIANLIRDLAEEKEVPVLAFVEDVAASGGYWLACAADEIYACDVSIVGSIGVISASFGLKELAERYGVERRIHTSGKDKSFLDPFLDEKPADVKRLKAIQKELHDSFKNWVSARRGNHLKGENKDLFEGAFWTGESAKSLGLIDDIGDIRTICREKYGEEVKFIDFEPSRGFIQSLVSGKTENTNLPQDIVNIIENKSMWARYGL